MRSIPAHEAAYVVVCRGPNCREHGGIGLRKRLAQLVRRDGNVRLVGYACFGQCDFGPNVVFYPSDEWRGALTPEDASAVLEYAHAGGAPPGRPLEPPQDERAQHLANIAEVVATVERDRARPRRARWWWPF